LQTGEAQAGRGSFCCAGRRWPAIGGWFGGGVKVEVTQVLVGTSGGRGEVVGAQSLLPQLSVDRFDQALALLAGGFKLVAIGDRLADLFGEADQTADGEFLGQCGLPGCWGVSVGLFGDGRFRLLVQVW